MDIVNKSKRSKIMSAIKGKDTKLELTIRRPLHHRGYRYRTNVRSLPGCPDLVFKKYRAVIFINGCFWHGHENCHLAYTPKSRVDFWTSKISATKQRDRKSLEDLEHIGWRTLCGAKL